MERNPLDKDIKTKCINFLRREIKSELGTVAENFLHDFPFPNDEKHSITILINTLENDEFRSIGAIIEEFKKETKFITTILGSQSDQSLYISGYFQYLKDKLYDEIILPITNDNFNILEKLQEFTPCFDNFPNNRDEFIKMKVDETNQSFIGNTSLKNEEGKTNAEYKTKFSKADFGKRENSIHENETIDELQIDIEKLTKNLPNNSDTTE